MELALLHMDQIQIWNNTMENLRKESFMEKANLHGKMGPSMKGFTQMGRNKDQESLPFQMEKYMKEIG